MLALFFRLDKTPNKKPHVTQEVIDLINNLSLKSECLKLKRFMEQYSIPNQVDQFQYAVTNLISPTGK